VQSILLENIEEWKTAYMGENVAAVEQKQISAQVSDKK
jgi:hypothetical protein